MMIARQAAQKNNHLGELIIKDNNTKSYSGNYPKYVTTMLLPLLKKLFVHCVSVVGCFLEDEVGMMIVTDGSGNNSMLSAACVFV